jgi:hypothetical protein
MKNRMRRSNINPIEIPEVIRDNERKTIFKEKWLRNVHD